MIIARFLCILGVAVVLASPVTAKTKPSPELLRQQARQLCINDATNLCNDSITDEAATFACLAENHDALSAGCRRVMDAAKKAQPQP